MTYTERYREISEQYKPAGDFWWRWLGKNHYADLFEISDFDESEYKHVPLKDGEKLFRYQTDVMTSNYGPILIKANPDKGLVYFLEDRDDDRAYFERRGVKAKFNL